MGIKAEINEKQEREYPWIGINSVNQIVLFEKSNAGTILSSGTGYYTDNWTESGFTRFTGSITLSNEN